MNLLVIEDDAVLGKSLQKGFDEAGHACSWARDGDRGLLLAKSNQYDALVLDRMLPGISGLDLLSRLRTEGIRTPTIMLTALGSVDDRVEGLMAGADDYVVKPFAFAELMARIEAVCRRSKTRPSADLRVGEVRLDLTARRVTCPEGEVDLTPTEFSLLEMLMRHAGNVVTRNMLCQQLWKSEWDGSTNVLEVHVNRLRGKLERGGAHPLIETVRGRGYVIRAT